MVKKVSNFQTKGSIFNGVQERLMFDSVFCSTGTGNRIMKWLREQSEIELLTGLSGNREQLIVTRRMR